MANRYSQIFTLKDIFNNKKLKDKLPLINYKEIEREDGKISRRTNAKTVNRLVFDTATSAARPFYRPITTTRSGDVMIIGGNLVGDHDAAVDAVYKAIISKRQVISYTANNADMIRNALKETEKNKRMYGNDTRLYLRVQSMAEIEGMNKKQIVALLNNIMENIYYGDNFPETQNKYGIKDFVVNSPLNYEQRKIKWKQRVGDE